jgi:hypothetical protein
VAGEKVLLLRRRKCDFFKERKLVSFHE